jgi:SNF2 family DNA or RNA helicase
MLVICPLSIIENAWGGDIARFTDFTWCNLRRGYEEANIYVTNYESILGDKFPKMLSKIKPDMIVLDESVRIKDSKAQITKTILKHGHFAKHRIVLSGCPAPNDMTEYWAQMMFVDKRIFSTSFYAFRNMYFHLQRGNQIMPATTFMTREQYANIFGKGFKYAITAQSKEKLIRQMQPWAIWIKKEDCLKLPEEIDVIRSVTLSQDERKAYKEMKKHLVTVIQQEAIGATNALSKIVKLREITSGFIINFEGKQTAFGNSKLNELGKVLEELGEKQAIIWVNFQHEVDRILSVVGIDKAAQVHGRIADKGKEIADFTSKTKQYLIANPASASEGLNLQQCDTQIFFSLSYSYSDYYQCRGRTHRSGQKNNCIYIHLVADDTIDEDILKVIRNKEEATELVHRFLKC